MKLRPIFFSCSLLLFLGFSLPSCSWVSLAYNALTYRTTSSGEVGNVAVHGSFAYATLAEGGLGVLDLATSRMIKTMPPPEGSESIDDISIANGFLFTLDARKPGYLSVFSLEDPTIPKLVSSPIPVAVGPFSGVSAGGGWVIVSGGTSELSAWKYDSKGILRGPVAKADLGRGQPDVLLAPDGRRAFVSTHTRGPHFGITVLNLAEGDPTLKEAGYLALEGGGFTAGGAKPANFPIECAVEKDLLLVAYSRGLALIDVGVTKGPPRLLKVMELEIEPVNVDLLDHTAAVVGSRPKPMVVFVDVGNPVEPKIVKSIPLDEGTYVTGVALSPSHVVVAVHEKGALVFKR